MKYSVLGFSQQKAVELGIGIDELIVLRWFVDFAGTSKMKTEFIDGKVFYWVNYQTIVDSLPVLRLKKQALRKKVFKNLCDAEVLIHKTIKVGGIFSYYAYGLNYDKLIYLEGSEVQTYPDNGYKRTQGLGTNIPNKDSSINDSSIINNNIYHPSDDNSPSGEEKKENTIKGIIIGMNEILGTSYKVNAKSTVSTINARLSEGHTKEDMLNVVKYKHAEWKDDAKMKMYLRPSTLFQASKFESYLMMANQEDKSEEDNNTHWYASSNYN